LKELAPGKALARIVTQFTDGGGSFARQAVPWWRQIPVGAAVGVLFLIAGTHGVLREIFRNLKKYLFGCTFGL
jgi:hypothetical protein